MGLIDRDTVEDASPVVVDGGERVPVRRDRRAD